MGPPVPMVCPDMRDWFCACHGDGTAEKYGQTSRNYCGARSQTDLPPGVRGMVWNDRLSGVLITGKCENSGRLQRYCNGGWLIPACSVIILISEQLRAYCMVMSLHDGFSVILACRD